MPVQRLLMHCTIRGGIMDFKSLASKKVFNIPVLYIAGAAVLVLAYFAWKMKTSSNTDTTGVDATADGATTTAADAVASGDYSGLNTQGTVTVVQGATTADAGAVKPTNEDWARSAVTWLISNKKATATQAQAAVDHYLSGNDLSYDESVMIDAVIASKDIGQPPEKVAIGNVGNAPLAQKQFSNFPGTHTVKGSNDNTAGKLATLYYGNSGADYTNLITANNAVLGPSTTTYTVGTVVRIPAWHTPKYYTVTGASDTRASQVAAKNGTYATTIAGLNPGVSEPYKKGQKLRVS